MTNATLITELMSDIREHRDLHQGSSEAAAPPLSPPSPHIPLLFSLSLFHLSFLPRPLAHWLFPSLPDMLGTSRQLPSETGW